MADKEERSGLVPEEKVQQIPVTILTGNNKKIPTQPDVTNAQIVPQDQQQQQQSSDENRIMYTDMYSQRDSRTHYDDDDDDTSQQQQSTDAIENQIKSLVLKSQIYLELLQDQNVVSSEADRFGQNIEDNIAKLVTPSDQIGPVATSLYGKTKECLVELGNLLNMQGNVLIGALDTYLDEAEVFIKTLGDDVFKEQKAGLEQAKCNPGDSQTDCLNKLNASIEKIKKLQQTMRDEIAQKEQALPSNERKQQIEELKTFLNNLNYEPMKIDDLIKQVNTKKDAMGSDGEKEILIELEKILTELKEKQNEQTSSKEEEQKLMEEQSQLKSEIAQLGAEQAMAETNRNKAESDLANIDTNEQQEEKRPEQKVNEAQNQNEGGDEPQQEENVVKKVEGVETPPTTEEVVETPPTTEEKVVETQPATK